MLWQSKGNTFSRSLVGDGKPKISSQDSISLRPARTRTTHDYLFKNLLPGILKEMEPSQDETKAGQVEAETDMDGTLSVPFNEKLQLFDEPLTSREISLLRAFNALTTADILNQLSSGGNVSNQEVARLLDIKGKAPISRFANQERTPKEDLARAIKQIALQRLSPKE